MIEHGRSEKVEFATEKRNDEYLEDANRFVL